MIGFKCHAAIFVCVVAISCLKEAYGFQMDDADDRRHGLPVTLEVRMVDLRYPIATPIHLLCMHMVIAMVASTA